MVALFIAGGVGARPAKRRKLFFSEEKKQKTFILRDAAAARPWPASIGWRRNKSLLVLFFRKEQSLWQDSYAACFHAPNHGCPARSSSTAACGPAAFECLKLQTATRKNRCAEWRSTLTFNTLFRWKKATRMQRRGDEPIYQVTARLRLAHRKNMARYALWFAFAATLFLADLAVNGYWKATTGHTILECYILHPAGCDTPSMKIHGE